MPLFRKKQMRFVLPGLAASIFITLFLYLTFRTHHKTIKAPVGKTKTDLRLAEHRIFRNAARQRRFGSNEGKALVVQGYGGNAQAAMMMSDVWDEEVPELTTTVAGPERKRVDLKDVSALHAVGDAVITTTAESQRPLHGWLHPTRTPDKVVVTGALAAQDMSWVKHELSGWGNAIYIVDAPSSSSRATLRTPANKGREALPYLTYIIEHYQALPRTVAFVHSHKNGWPEAWHTDNDLYSNVWSLTHLDTSFVQRDGFVNLRCTPEPGCPDEMILNREPRDQNRTAELALPAAIAEMFGGVDEEGEDFEISIPPIIATPCCAQFAVSRSQILQVPLRTYERMQRWLLDTELPDETSGRVMEYLWHIVFGRDAVFCPDFEQCWCDVYGDCSGLEQDKLKKQEAAKKKEKHKHKRDGG